MNLSKLQETEKDGEAWHAAALGISKSRTQPTEQKQIYMAFCKRQNYRKGNRSAVVKVKEVEGVDHKWTVWGIGGIMKCSVLWLGRWAHDFMYLPKSIGLYTTNSIFYMTWILNSFPIASTRLQVKYKFISMPYKILHSISSTSVSNFLSWFTKLGPQGSSQTASFPVSCCHTCIIPPDRPCLRSSFGWLLLILHISVLMSVRRYPPSTCYLKQIFHLFLLLFTTLPCLLKSHN